MPEKSAAETSEAERRFWLDRSVLVTGATGLCGGWLVRRLLDHGADVVCLVRDAVPQCELVRARLVDKVKVVEGDVCDQALLERTLGEYEVKVVFHLAAQTIVGIANRNPVSTFESNIRGTWALLEAARRSPAVGSVVVASSDKAYGQAAVLPTPESAPLDAVHPYDVSKSCADLVARSYGLTYKLPVAITRCGNFYGGGDLNWNRIVPGTIRSVVRGENPVIRSDGNYLRDYVYIEDAAIAYMLLGRKLAENPALAGQAFNFACGAATSARAIAQRIVELMGSKATLDIRNEATSEIREQYLDASRARDVLGWRPAFDMETGLQRTIAWYRDFLAAQPSP